MARGRARAGQAGRGSPDLSTRSLLLASAAYIAVGVVAGGLLANSAVLSGAPEKIQEAAATVARTVSNKEAKHDRLALPVKVALRAPIADAFATDMSVATGSLPDSTRSAYAAVPPAQSEQI